jgi:hypothetical protein
MKLASHPFQNSIKTQQKRDTPIYLMNIDVKIQNTGNQDSTTHQKDHIP